MRNNAAERTMHAVGSAILAVALLAAAGPLAEPRHVRFELAGGPSLSGTMTAWDAEGLDGSFGRRRWSELAPRDAWRLYVSVMDRGDPHQWIDLGRALLETPEGESWAERAFRRALRLDASLAGRIREVRSAAEARRRARDAARRAAEAERLRTATPEAGTFPGEPWPPPAPGAQELATGAVRALAEARLGRVGLRPVPLRTAHFVLYSDAPARAAARMATRLEAVYARTAALLGVDGDYNVFHGRAAAFYFGDRDRFRLVEAESFGQLVTARTVAICHPVGPDVFLVLCCDDGAASFEAALAHETVHGFLHRYRSPRRPPPWANEGIADHVAAQIVDGGPPQERRRGALRFLRSGGDVDALLDLAYGEAGTDDLELAGAVGALLIELMVRQRPEAFRAWIDAVKSGRNWQAALAGDYGVPRARLVPAFVQYYTVND